MSGEGRKYRVLGILGKGGFGTVYRGELLASRGFTKPVALKVLNPEAACIEDVAERLRDEARLLALLRHRAIVQVDSLVFLDGHWTVVMELVDGVDLRRLVSHIGPVPPGPALEIVREVASALHAAFDRAGPDGQPLRVLHRDIKPSNIQLTRAGEVKVLDFGVARADFSTREARTQALIFGSTGYIAPERLFGVDSHAGDVYALGVVLYEMLLGSNLGALKATEGGYTAQLNAALDILRESCRTLPGGECEAMPDLLSLLSDCLSFEPESRPDAHEVDRRARALSRRFEEPWLADWADRVVQEIPPRCDTGSLTGRILSESFPSSEPQLALAPLQSTSGQPLFPFAPPIPNAVTSAFPRMMGEYSDSQESSSRSSSLDEPLIDEAELTDYSPRPASPERGLLDADTMISPIPADVAPEIFFPQPPEPPTAGSAPPEPAPTENDSNTEWVALSTPPLSPDPLDQDMDPTEWTPAHPETEEPQDQDRTDPRISASNESYSDMKVPILPLPPLPFPATDPPVDSDNSRDPAPPEDPDPETESAPRATPACLDLPLIPLQSEPALSQEPALQPLPPDPSPPGPRMLHPRVVQLSALAVVIFAGLLFLLYRLLPSTLSTAMEDPPPEITAPVVALPIPADPVNPLGDPASTDPTSGSSESVDLPPSSSDPTHPAPPPARTKHALVKVVGAERPELIAERVSLRPGVVPAGRYTVLAHFPSGFVDSSCELVLQPSTEVLVSCDPLFERCKVANVRSWKGH